MSYHPNDVACPTCGMGQGQQCRTLTTNRSTDTHEARREQAHLAASQRARAERETEEAPGPGWRMHCHDNGGRLQHFGERWWVEIHDLPDPIVEVDLREVAKDDPGGTHWGWIDAAETDPVMIWEHRGAFDMQFPYGPEAEEERGKGRVVRLAVRKIDETEAAR